MGADARPPLVPAADPGAVDRLHGDQIQEAALRVLGSGRYVLGEEVAAFEAAWAQHLGVGHAVGVANGTEALTLALRALGVGPGDAVVTVSHTAVATVAAVHSTGATPVLVDVRADDALLDVAAVSDLLEQIDRGAGPVPAGTVKAVVAVHLYGAAVDLSALADVTRRWGVAVVEDCAQAHGTTYDGRPVGSYGVVSSFSFYPTKNLGAVGDGGAVVTSDPGLAERVRRLRQYGWSRPQYSEEPGVNSRLDELQAAVLLAKLPHLERHNDRRRGVARRYLDAFGKTSLELPGSPVADHTFHQFAVRSDDRDGLADALARRGVQTAVHYPTPVHRQPGYTALCRVPEGGLPVTDRWARSELSLPVHPGLDDEQVERVVDGVLKWEQGR